MATINNIDEDELVNSINESTNSLIEEINHDGEFDYEFTISPLAIVQVSGLI